MQPWVVEWNDVEQAKLEQVGGKGRNLVMLRQIEGVQVPDGFSVTTAAYNRAIEQQPTYRALLDELAQLTAADLVRVREISRRVRELLIDTVFSDELIAAVTASLSRFAAQQPFAVRSSATAEDLPDASYAGQQESYLHVIGQQAVLAHIRQCWASLFTDRAVIYRMQQGIDHRQVSLSVIIQRMVLHWRCIKTNIEKLHP